MRGPGEESRSCPVLLFALVLADFLEPASQDQRFAYPLSQLRVRLEYAQVRVYVLGKAVVAPV
jgi:hypothetical protein